jgi:hypothetical protein
LNPSQRYIPSNFPSRFTVVAPVQRFWLWPYRNSLYPRILPETKAGRLDRYSVIVVLEVVVRRHVGVRMTVENKVTMPPGKVLVARGFENMWYFSDSRSTNMSAETRPRASPSGRFCTLLSYWLRGIPSFSRSIKTRLARVRKNLPGLTAKSETSLNLQCTIGGEDNADVRKAIR